MGMADLSLKHDPILLQGVLEWVAIDPAGRTPDIFDLTRSLNLEEALQQRPELGPKLEEDPRCKEQLFGIYKSGFLNFLKMRKNITLLAKSRRPNRGKRRESR